MTTCKTICVRFGNSAFIGLYKTVGCRVITTYFVSFQLSFIFTFFSHLVIFLDFVASKFNEWSMIVVAEFVGI